jgi:chemotaxis signal transduction protein/HPt (histidine-containing phosphotransfer) domain-containing protein
VGDFDDLIEEFVTESREHIADIEEDLIKIEADMENADPEVINRVFRAAHSIKGSAKFLDLTNIGDLAHKLEDVLNLIRSGKVLPSSDVANPLLQAADMLKNMFEDVTSSNDMDISEHAQALQVIINGAGSSPAAKGKTSSAASPADPLSPFGVDSQVISRKLATSQVYIVNTQLGDQSPEEFTESLGALGEVLGSCRKEGGTYAVLFSSIMEADMVPLALGISQGSFTQVTQAMLGKAVQQTTPQAQPKPQPQKAPENKPQPVKKAAPAPRAYKEDDMDDEGDYEMTSKAKEEQPLPMKEKVLKKKVEDEEKKEEDNTSFITFSLESETYAVPIQAIEEIIGYQDISLLPNVPGFIKGVINLRGELVPIMDLRLKFRLEPLDYNPLTVFLIVRIEEKVMGLVVDNVADVLVIDPTKVQKTPVFSARISTDFIEGVYKDSQNQMVILVDVAALTKPEEWDVAA